MRQSLHECSPARCWTAAGGLAWSAAAGATTPDPLGVAAVLQVVAGLAVVLGLFGLTAWLLRRLGAVKAGGRAGALRIVDSLALSARDRLVLVEVAGERVLLGLSPGRISALHRVEGPAATAGTSAASTFAAHHDTAQRELAAAVRT